MIFDQDKYIESQPDPNHFLSDFTKNHSSKDPYDGPTSTKFLLKKQNINDVINRSIFGHTGGGFQPLHDLKTQVPIVLDIDLPLP